MDTGRQRQTQIHMEGMAACRSVSDIGASMLAAG